MEYKTLPQYIKTIEDRTVSGVFAVHGNVDGGGDRSHPGSFAKTISEGMGRIKFLWMHNPMDPPTAVIKALREIGRDDLPPAVLAAAPEATGGAEVVREYLPTPRGEEILVGIKSGAITEMSYGYDPLKWDIATEGSQRVRNLRELRLWDISDVTWGMNPATAGSKSLLPLEMLFEQLQALNAEILAGNGEALNKDRRTVLHDLAKAARACDCADMAVALGESRAAVEALTQKLDFARQRIAYMDTVARLTRKE